MVKIMNKEQFKHLLIYMTGPFATMKRNPIPSQSVVCYKSQVKFYADTPNTIIYFKTDTEEGFFRECRLHSDARSYLRSLLEDYCKYVFDNEYSSECLRYLQEDLSDISSFRKFFNMGAGTASYSRISEFRRTNDPAYIGIRRQGRPGWYYDQLLKLVQFAWGPLDEYRYCKTRRGIYQTFSSIKTKGTYVIDSFFGVGVVPDSNYIILNLDGKERIGICVSVAKGEDPTKYNLEKNRIKPQLQRRLSQLNLLDVICYQKDHRPGNYFIISDIEGGFNDISVFDNDCPTTFLPSLEISFQTYCGCSPIVKKGQINRPYFDYDLANQIIKCDLNRLNNYLRPFMPAVLRWFTIIRIELLRRVLKKAVKTKKSILLKQDEWTLETIEEEVSGKYGRTYLSVLINTP